MVIPLLLLAEAAVISVTISRQILLQEYDHLILSSGTCYSL